MRDCDEWSCCGYRYEMDPDILFEWIELILAGVQPACGNNIVTEDFRGFSLSHQASSGILFRRYKI